MRKILLLLVVISTSLVFILRLYYLQVYATEPYSIYEDNAIRKVFTYPKRGYIYDRNNNLLVSNQPSYDVMIIPGLVKELDTTEFCKLLKISKDYFDNKIEVVFSEKFLPRRGRINCSMKDNYGWRWFGTQFTLN